MHYSEWKGRNCAIRQVEETGRSCRVQGALSLRDFRGIERERKGSSRNFDERAAFALSLLPNSSPLA